MSYSYCKRLLLSLERAETRLPSNTVSGRYIFNTLFPYVLTVYSLKHRMPPITEGTKPVLNEIQPNLHPLEVLFDISKLMTIENVRRRLFIAWCMRLLIMTEQEQPLSASFEKLVQAVGLYDHCVDAQTIPIVEAEQWGQHAVQSVLWSAAGISSYTVSIL